MAIVSPPRPSGAPDVEPAPRTGAGVATRHGRGLRSRLSAGHLVMVVAGLVGVVLSVAVLRDRPSGVRVVVADGEISAGDVIDGDDVRSERVQASGALLGTLVRASDRHDLRGRIAVTRIGDGEPVIRSQLRRRAANAGLRAMSIPIEASRAAGGRIEPGDRVDVVFAGAHEASIIVADARVLAVDEPGRGGIGEVSQPFTVTIAVDAHAVAAARGGDRRR